MKKILVFLLTAALLAAVTALAVSCGEEPPIPENDVCTEHVDANKNGECDKCGADVPIPCPGHYDNDEDNICDNEDCGAVIHQPIAYTVTVIDGEGNPVSGVNIKLVKIYSGGTREIAEDKTSGTDGKFSGTIVPGDYLVEASELPRGWYLTENQMKIEFSEDAHDIILNAVDNNPAGTEDDPHFLGDENFIEPFDANETLYFFVKGAIYVEISTPGASLTYKGETYTTEGGKISVLLEAPASENSRTEFFVTNTKSEVNEITLVPVAIPGSTGNPFDLELGESVNVTITRDGTVYYEWTASASGTFRATAQTADATIFLTNLRNSQTTQASGSASISLTAGDTVRVAVSYSFGTDNSNTTEDDTAEVVFTTSFN